jgi:hypothetical protein
VGYGSAQLGITPMIGQNDSPGEIFTLANAQSLRSNVVARPSGALAVPVCLSRNNYNRLARCCSRLF